MDPGRVRRRLWQLPSLGVYREAVHARHHNRGTTWRPNDLTDLVYLSCAAAYADVVVCEGHMSGILRQGLARLGRPAAVRKTLPEAVPSVEAALARGPS